MFWGKHKRSKQENLRTKMQWSSKGSRKKPWQKVRRMQKCIGWHYTITIYSTTVIGSIFLYSIFFFPVRRKLSALVTEKSTGYCPWEQGAWQHQCQSRMMPPQFPKKVKKRKVTLTQVENGWIYSVMLQRALSLWRQVRRKHHSQCFTKLSVGISFVVRNIWAEKR